MTKPIERDRIYRGRRFQTETIELCVRWYITYRQYSFGRGRSCWRSLKHPWDRVLAQSPPSDSPHHRFPPVRPRMHQNSRAKVPRRIGPHELRPLRRARKVFDGSGLVSVTDAERQPVLALQLSFRRKTQDARLRHPSRCLARQGEGASPGSALASC